MNLEDVLTMAAFVAVALLIGYDIWLTRKIKPVEYTQNIYAEPKLDAAETHRVTVNLIGKADQFTEAARLSQERVMLFDEALKAQRLRKDRQELLIKIALASAEARLRDGTISAEELVMYLRRRDVGD